MPHLTSPPKNPTINETSIALSNPKSPTNVGAVMRAAGCYRVDSVFYTGERYERAVKFQTDTKNVRHKIPLTLVASFTADAFKDRNLVCVELVEGAISLPEFEHPDNAVYVFGPEDGTIEQSVIDAAVATVYIPTVGCMNLAATVNVLLYDKLAKQALKNKESVIQGDDLIRASRDRNNNVTVNHHR
jgi:tRNA(Leu) C34 or U34 (ribose-2'-O)-methylase TrmL